MSHLNSDHLRTFLAIEQAGSVTAGAERIGRSQSATSLQIKQLEEIIGQPVFRRHGRGVRLTAVGEKLRPVALTVVQSLDTVLMDLRGGGLKGKLRIGLSEDHSRTELADIISNFALVHADVELEVRCALGSVVADALNSGDLDLAVHEQPEPVEQSEVLRRDELVWVCSRDRDLTALPVLPIAVFDRACWWRELALSSLTRAGVAYQVVFSSESAAGVRSAVRSGMAAGLISVSDMEDGLVQMPHISERFPTYLVLQRARGATGPICEAMCLAIKAAFIR